MEGEWSSYSYFNGGVTEGASLKEGELSCYNNGRENSHVKEVVFNGGSMVMLQRSV